jgi:hypothetical protein
MTSEGYYRRKWNGMLYLGALLDGENGYQEKPLNSSIAYSDTANLADCIDISVRIKQYRVKQLGPKVSQTAPDQVSKLLEDLRHFCSRAEYTKYLLNEQLKVLN